MATDGVQTMATIRVGIDLGPAEMGRRAPGTARLVQEEARALFKLDVPWRWVPLVRSENNPLFKEVQHLNPNIVPGPGTAWRATFRVGKAWARADCRIGFATAYFVPWRGIPVVANFFDANIYEHGVTWIKSDQRLNLHIMHALNMLSVKRAKRLFVLSNYCANVLRAQFPQEADKFVVIPPAASREPAAPDRPRWLPGGMKPYFLYCGAFSDNKNQHRLIEAWSLLQGKHPDLPCLVLAGPCDDSYRAAKINPTRASCPRPSEILLPGLVPAPEIGWLYDHATAYVQPSLAEGFGMPAIEAMHHGLPVASSNTTSLPETCGDAALYFNPLDVSDLCRSVEQLWKDDELRGTLIARGKARAGKFTWEQTAKHIAREIDAALAYV